MRSQPARGFIEFVVDNRTYAVWPVPIRDLDFTNLYGTDVTAERAIVKFPDQNPNPVFRIQWDGTLAYANQASAALIGGLGLHVGSSLPDDLRETLLERVRAADGVRVEVESAERIYALLPVDVPEFGFINVYGTDVTAVKTIERLARENERLLLNVLPEPIAERLRAGRAAHRGSLRRRDPAVRRHRRVHSPVGDACSPRSSSACSTRSSRVFDDLVDRYGLEKVKTIGDAYMVVGGMSERADDHTVRVARDGARSGRIGRSYRSGGPSRDRVPDRHPLRPRRRRCDRHEEVHLRRLGRHGEHGQPDGVTGRPWTDPRDTRRRGTPSRVIRGSRLAG